MGASPSNFLRVRPRHSVGVLAAFLLAAMALPVAAQPTAPAKRAVPAANRPTPALPAPDMDRVAEAAPVPFEVAPELAPLGPALAGASRDLLSGDEWQDTLIRFEQWLSVQTLYDTDQVVRMRTKFNARTSKLPTSARKQFIRDVDAKLQILYGPTGVAVENYFVDSLAAASPVYVKKMRQHLPDVVEVSPQQLQEKLSRFTLKNRSTASVHQKFEQMRQVQITANEARADARRAAPARPAASHVALANKNQQGRGGFTQARDYFPQNNSSISYSIIPAMPMMTSGGWAMFGGGVAINITRNR